MENPIKARQLHEKVLRTRSRLLGSEDARTIRSMVNLAGTLRELGDLPAARSLFEPVSQLRQRIHGPTDRHTTATAWSLFRTVAELQDIESARDVLLEHLMWLIAADPNVLSSEQALLRDRLREFLKAGNP